MYQVLIVEDTPQEADVLRGHLKRYAVEHALQLQIEVKCSAFDLIDAVPAADLIFMDIGLPGINGMEAAEMLRANGSQTPLIFVTDLAQYAVQGYRVDALDFVVKPVEYHDFAMRMDRAVRVMRRNNNETIALPTREGIQVVRLSDITYIDLHRHDVLYHLASGGTPLRERGSLRATAERLADHPFLRISSGCLVNMTQVIRIGPLSVTMSDGTELFYSRSQRKLALETLANFVGRSL